jgi:serine/threonine-protein kinase
LQACEALAEAHVVGIVHRDLKPANVFVARRADGSACVKLLDFGISKFETDGADGALTNGETVFGSPAYMPPEQIRSTRDVDARGDLWSLGATLFELLVGRPPFRADTLPELCVRILEERTPDLACLLPGVPPGLDATVHRCLAKERDARFATVAELASALEPFAPEEARLSVRRIARIMGGSGRAAAAAHPKTMPALDFEIERFQEARTMRSDDGVVVPAQPQARLGDDVGGSTPTSTEWRHRKPKWLPAFFAVGAGAAVVGAVAIAGPLRSGPMPPPQQVSAAPPDSTPTSIAFRGAAQPSTAPARSDVVEIPAALVSVAPAPWRARGPAPSVAVRPSTVARPAGAAAPSASASREVKENAKTQPELAPLDTEGFGDRK